MSEALLAVAELGSERLLAASLACLPLALAVWLVSRLAPRLPAALSAALWWLVGLKMLLGLVAPAIALPLLPGPRAAALPAAAPAVSAPTALLTPDGDDPVRTGSGPWVLPARSSPERIASVGPMNARLWLLAVWLAGALGSGALCVRDLARARALRRAATPASDPRLLGLLREAAGDHAQAPGLLLSDRVPGPLVVGLLDPVIVLPRELVARLDDQAIRFTLAHELAHLARRDLWLGLVPAAARAAFFFHPVAWLAEREYRIAREAACDEAVVRRAGGDAHAYGKLLLAFGIRAPGDRSAFIQPVGAGLASIAAPTSRSALRRRLLMLDHLLDQPLRRGRGLRLAAALLLIAAGVSALPFRLVAAAPSSDDAVASEPVASATPAVTTNPAANPTAAAPIAVTPRPAPRPEAAPAAEPAPRALPRTPEPSRSASGVPRVPAMPAMPSVPRALPAHGAIPPWPAPAVAGMLPPGVPRIPLPPAFGWHDSGCLDRPGDEDTAWVLAIGDSQMMCGSGRDLRAARRARQGQEDLLWFRIDEDEYVVRDPQTLARARALIGIEDEMIREQERLGAQQAELGQEQAALGVRQAELGMKQAELGLGQARLAVREARGALAASDGGDGKATAELDAERERVGREMHRLGDEMEKLGEEQARLGERQEQLGREQERLGAEQSEKAAASAKDLARLLEQAMASGAAERRR